MTKYAVLFSRSLMKRPAPTGVEQDSSSAKAPCRPDLDLAKMPHLLKAGLAGETAKEVADKVTQWHPEPSTFTHGLVAEVEEMFKGGTVHQIFVKCLLTSLEIAEEKQDRALLTRAWLFNAPEARRGFADALKFPGRQNRETSKLIQLYWVQGN